MSDFPPITIIVGSGRSGTSFLQKTLRDSMEFGFYREPKYIIPIYRQLHRFGDLSQPQKLHHLVATIHNDRIFRHLSEIDNYPSSPEEILERVIEPTYSGVLYAVFQLMADKQGKSRLGYKFPSDIIHLPLLAQIFPTARFVHSIRDGRDVAASMLKFKWGPTNLYAGADYWAKRTTKGRMDGKKLSGRYLEFRFEDLIEDTERVGYLLGQFIDRDLCPESVQYFINQVNATKDNGIVYAWQNTLDENQRYLCEAAAADVLAACNYRLEYGGRAKISPVRTAYYLMSNLFGQGINRLTKYNKRAQGSI